MAADKFSATWVSHSSMGDFLKCPRAYYLKNLYKDPKTKHKIQLMSPALALGAAVHEVVEGLSKLPTKERFNEKLVPKFEQTWEKYTGMKGGFFDIETEYKAKERGMAMLRRIETHPGPLLNLAVKIKEDLPWYWISEEENIILCGKIDWLEYLEESDGVHIIDFKTSKSEEENDSLQLPIYHLLVTNAQNRKVEKASYWYLEFNDEPTPKELPDLEEAKEMVLKIARQMKTARQLERFTCPQDGCRACRELEVVIAGEAEYVGQGSYGADMYVIRPKKEAAGAADSVVL